MKTIKLFAVIILMTLVVSCTSPGGQPSSSQSEPTTTQSEQASEQNEQSPSPTEDVEPVSLLPEGIALAENANIDWKQFEGTEISVLFSNHPWQEAVEPLVPQFEALTGIDVRIVSMPESDFLTKVPADFTAGTFAFDVFMSQYYDAAKYQSEGWTANIEPLMNDSSLTDSNWYAWDDFFPAARDIAVIGGRYTDRVAITSEAQVLMYRKDIFDKLGIKEPETFDQVLDAAKRIDEEEDRVAGITLRGASALWWPMYGVIKSYGGDYFNSEFEPVINSEASKSGAEMYAALTKYTPEGITSYDWDEINSAMLSGQAAMVLDSSVMYARLTDPKVSTVSDKIAMAPFPSGPEGRKAHSHYWSLSIADNSQKKGAAWLFVQWATSQPVMYEIGLTGVLPPRASVWEQEAFTTQFSEDFANSVKTSLESAVISPAHEKFFETMDVLRAEMQSVILGDTDVEPALDRVQTEWEPIMQTVRDNLK